MTKILLGRAFNLLWLSETAFGIGSALSNFALGVWVFERTQSAEQFSLTILSGLVPALLITPIAGGLADRFDRRWVIAICDVIYALFVIVIAAVLFTDNLKIVHLYIFNAVTAVIGAIRGPSHLAAVSAIVPKERLTQAVGMIEFSQGIVGTFAPVVAGYLMIVGGLKWIFLVELVLVIGGSIAMFRAISHVKRAIRGVINERPLTVMQATVTSFHSALGYFKEQPMMIMLVVYTVLQEGLLALVSSMIVPLVLSTHSSDVMGLVMTCGALGGLVSAMLMITLNVNKRMMFWTLICDLALSLSIVVAGFSTTTWLWCLCAFFALFAGSTSGTFAGVLWMHKTPKAKQGSIFAFMAAIHLLCACVALTLGGSLGERFLEPMLAAGGAWTDTIGTWIGTGKGRGYGFLFIVAGTLGMVASMLALAHPRLRHLDDLVSCPPEDPEAVSAAD